jgi:hypothetical protein
MNKISQIQTILGVDTDGIWGAKSQNALDELIHPRVTGWEFLKVAVEGVDLVIGPGVVTAFGGTQDRMDSGETASGLSTKDNPSYLGCALPMRRDSSPVLRGSPVPKLPWLTNVIFELPDGSRSVGTKLIDEGPARWTQHIGDLTVAAAKAFDPAANANNFSRNMLIRVIGGAKYLP